jgi:aryl-alcohol dehydrogenase-like predicted oxidoreductase
MEYREFGRTGWQISEIGFGAWQLGGTWGNVDDKSSVETLHYAFEKGINFVDTAIAYGKGRSESVVGMALKEWSGDMIYVATKVAPQGTDFQSNNTIKGRYPLNYLREQVESSLKRLGTDTIDLLQLHLWFEDGTNEFEWLEGLIKLVQEGKIRYFGVSLEDIKPSTGVLLAKSGIVASQQVIYNLFEQEPERELFPEGEKTNTAFIARVPFDSGALTGTWNSDTYNNWEENDKRYQMYRNGRFNETLARVDNLELLCSAYYSTLAEAAMRFSLGDTAVNTVVCGMRNKSEIDMNSAYSDGIPFNRELRDKVREHEWKHQFYK